MISLIRHGYYEIDKKLAFMLVEQEVMNHLVYRTVHDTINGRHMKEFLNRITLDYIVYQPWGEL